MINSETTYEHVYGEETFTVTAAERWSIGLILRLKKSHPDDVEIVHVNGDGSLLAHLPAAWMRIVPKKKVVMSEERRAETAERLRAAREAKSV